MVTGAPATMLDRREELTPMLAQYVEVAERYDDAIVLFRVGDFYKAFCEAAETVAEEVDDERWFEVSSHDLRRSWATFHLVERQVDVRTMMSVGGWSDYSAIEPYLAEPTESRIGAAMR